MSVEDAVSLKNEGNQNLSAGRYDEAIDLYTQAIELDPQHTFYSNRSAAYLSKGDSNNALKDALKCIELNSGWPKGYSRKGAALHSLGKLDEAITAYKEGLKIDPQNAALQNGLDQVLAEKQQEGGGMPGMPNIFGPDMWAKIAMHPKLKGYLSDPTYVQALQRLQQNPNSIQNEMNDQRILETFMGLMGMDMNMAGAGGAPPEEQGQQGGQQEAAAPPAAATPAPATPKPEPVYANETEDEKTDRLNKEAAAALKLEGNKLYKARNFDAALAKYSEAIATDETDMSFYTNRAAVHFEMKNFSLCVSDCEKAIEVGRSNRAKYELIAKAYARIGNAQMKLKNFELAVENYQNSLLEHRTYDTEKRLKQAQKKQKDAAAAAYINPEEGELAKARGNELFKGGDFAGAIKEYTDAIARNPEMATYYCNRGAAYTKLTDFVRGRNDCEKALQLDPEYVKAYSRLGAIQYFMKEYHKALDTYNKGLALDPENVECRDGLQRVTMAVQSSAGQPADKERAAHAMADPEIQAIMSDPVMQQVLRDMSTDASAAQRHLRDPGIAAKLEKLIAAGVLQVG